MTKVFVITPVFQPDMTWLNQCIASVRAQTTPDVTHVLVSDGDTSFAPPIDFQGISLTCKKNYADYGDTPRFQGIRHSIEAGADVVALLDYDNWFEPVHIETAIAAQREVNADVVLTRRSLVHLDGTPLGVCRHCGEGSWADTSAMVYFPGVYKTLSIWKDMQHWQHAIGDRVVCDAIARAGHRLGCTNRPTLNGATSHSGRRWFITRLAHSGVSPKVIMTLAGHRSLATTQRYIDVNDEMMARAVERL